MYFLFQMRFEAAITTQKQTIKSEVPQTDGLQSQTASIVAYQRTLRSNASCSEKYKTLKVIRYLRE